MWLPLDGNLKNKGTDPSYDVPSTNYAAWVSDGKIGGQSLNATTTISGVLSYSKTLTNDHSYSICAWIKTSSTVTTSRYIVWTGSDSNGVGFGLRMGGATNAQAAMFGTNINMAIQSGKWHHVAMTIDYENLKFSAYLDGTFVDTKSYSVNTVVDRGVNVGWLRPSYYPFLGYINDVRIYDYCLSAAEVKEISRGLICHYKLDDPLIESTTNLLQYSNLQGHGSSWTLQSEKFEGEDIYKNVVTNPDAGNNAGFSIRSSFTPAGLSTATKVTLSFYKRLNTVYGKNLNGYLRVVKSDSTDGTYQWSYNKANWANDPNSIGKWEFVKATVTIPTGCTSIKHLYVYVDRATGGDCDYSKIQLEFKDHPTPYVSGTRNPISKYDSNMYIESDGSTWLRIVHHNNPANGIFTRDSAWSDGVYIDSNRWFDMYDTVQKLSTFEFMVKQKTTSDATEVKYRWIQNVSPIGATYNQVKPSEVTRITTSGYTDGTYGGLYITNVNSHLCIANATNGNWYGALGCWTTWNGGIPGYPNSVVTTGYIDLYVRIDNILPKLIDCSGYNNHMKIIGYPTVINDSIRYSNVCHFINGQYAISPVASNSGYLPTDQLTVNVWARWSTWNNPISCTEGGGFNFENLNGGLRFPLNIQSVGYVVAQTDLNPNNMKNEWHMLTGTFDGTNVAMYVDGQLKHSMATGSTNGIRYASAALCISAEAQSATAPASSSMVGEVSDTRIYATALSAEDVLKLYQVAAYVDNKQNIHTFEFKESQGETVLKDWSDIDLITMTGWSGSKSYDDTDDCLVLTATNGWRTFGWNTQSYSGQTLYIDFDYRFTDISNLTQNVYCTANSTVTYKAAGTTLDYSQVNVWKHCRIQLTADNYFIIMIRGTDDTGLSVTLNIKNLSIVTATQDKSNIEKAGIINTTIFKELGNKATIGIDNIKANVLLES